MGAFEIVVLCWLMILTIAVAWFFLIAFASQTVCKTCGNLGVMLVGGKLITCPDCESGKQSGS